MSSFSISPCRLVAQALELGAERSVTKGGDPSEILAAAALAARLDWTDH